MQVLTMLTRREIRTMEEKRMNWEIDRRGRRVWLQCLAMRILSRYGKRVLTKTPKVESIRVQVDYDSIVKAAAVQFEELRLNGLEPECIYLGSDFVEMWRTEFLRMHTNLEERTDFIPRKLGFSCGIHTPVRTDVRTIVREDDNVNELVGLPLVVVPNFQGLFVAPKLR